MNPDSSRVEAIPSSLLGDYIDIQTRLDSDQLIDRDTLKRRDRKIGLDQSKEDDASLLRHWVSVLRGESSERQSAGIDTARAVRGLVAVLWVAGLTVGLALARATLDYDGRVPVNLFSALLILVGLQLFTLLVLALLLVVRGRGVLRSLSLFNPANIAIKLGAKFSGSTRTALDTFASFSNNPGGRKVIQSLLVNLSQHFAVALNVGILLMLFYLVTISDLAFGWNTTLKADEAAVHQGFETVALPWSAVLPAAVPDLELVKTSRFYRLAGQLRGTDWKVDQYGTWWLFVLMCIAVYGLLPRLIALAGFGFHHDRVLTRAMLNSPGASQAIARMRSPLIQTSAESSETSIKSGASGPLPRKRQPGRELKVGLVNWSGALASNQRVSLPGISVAGSADAGGQQSLEQDRSVMSRIASRSADGTVVAVKAWEPPTLEFRDFLTNLREALGVGPMLLVVLQPLPDSSVQSTQIDTWEQGLASLSDPALYVEAAS